VLFNEYSIGWRRGVVVSGVRQWTKLTHVGTGYNWDGWPSSGEYTISGCNQPTRSTQPCIPPGSLNRVPASAWGKGVNVISAGWQVILCDPIWHVSSRSGEASRELLCSVYLYIYLWLFYAAVWSRRRCVRRATSSSTSSCRWLFPASSATCGCCAVLAWDSVTMFTVAAVII